MNYKTTILALLIIVCTGCSGKIIKNYTGDGVLSCSRGILFTPIYNIQLPELDITKPHTEKYDLRGLPSSKVFYSISLIVPSSGEITPSDRKTWGTCNFEVRKNGEVVVDSKSEFHKMTNWQFMREKTYMNGFYTMSLSFMNPDPADHWELIFECSGFESDEPVNGYLYLKSGGA